MAKVKKFDAIFAVVLALTAVVSISAVHAEREKPDKTEPKETVCQVTTEPTTTETTEATQEPSEATQPVTEATEPTETEATQPTETVPPAVLYDVPLATELQLHIINEAEAHGIDPAIIFAMCFRESSYRSDVIGDNGNSYGLMQIQPRFHYERMERLGCTDLLDPFQNVTVGIDLLAELLDWYDGDIWAALTAYNRGHYAGTITQYAINVMATADELRGETYVLF